jgi:hypothetical protein
VYAGTAFSGVYRSDDGGTTWHAMGLNSPGLIVRSLAIDHAPSRTVYAGTDADGVFKHTGGSNWEPLGTGLVDLFIGAVAVDPTLRGRVYAATGAGVVVIDQSSEQPGCLGDYDDSGVVTIDELLLAVDILLGHQPLANHPGLDENRNRTLEVGEVIHAIRNALLGCG